jgi:hypothetical protein
MAKGTYVGFLKLKRELASKPGVTNPAGLAASIGRKKYGAKKFDAAASKGHKVTEDSPGFNPRMGNHRGSKNTKTALGANGQYRPT